MTPNNNTNRQIIKQTGRQRFGSAGDAATSMNISTEIRI